MYIKCWGSRGSIPVCGEEYFRYGGDTTCLEIRTRSGDIIIVDAGTGIRKLGNQLIQENHRRFDFIFTHAHWDHLMGFPFFKPLYCARTEIRMRRCPFPRHYVKQMISTLMAPPNFPVPYSDLKAKIVYEQACPTEFQIGSVQVIPIPISHPNRGTGYKFIEGRRSFVFLTDNELGFVHPGGLPYEAYADFAADADLLIHDAEYTPAEYVSKAEWGHSSYTDALRLAHEAGVKKLGLFHHNQDRTDEQMDAIVRICRQETTSRKLQAECFAVGSGMELRL